MLKAGQNDVWIQENLKSIMSYVRLQPLNEKTVHKTWKIRQRYGLSVWDCQIIAAALESDCSLLYSEDLQSGQIIEGLKVLNLFLK